ncbi:hypothetical protein Tco_1330902, partial [Tanacetum coccineum]
MDRQCTQPKRPRNVAWFKEKAMLAKAYESGQILDEEQLVFLADPGIPDGQASQTTIPNTAAFQTEDIDAYDSNYVILEVPNFEYYHNDLDNQSVHAMQDFEQTPVVEFTDNEITSDSNIIQYSQYLLKTQPAAVQDTNLYAQQDSMILSVIEQMSEQMINHEELTLKQQIDSLEQKFSNQIREKESLLQTFTAFKNKSKEKESKYMDKEIDLENRIKELDNNVYKVGQSTHTVHMLTKLQVFYDDTHKQALGYQNLFYLMKAQWIKPTLYDGSVISSQHIVLPVIDDEAFWLQTFWLQTSQSNTDQSASSPVKIEAPKELPKVSLVNTTLKKLKYHFGQFDTVVKKHITPDAITEGEWGFKHTKAMEAVVQQCSINKQCFKIHKKELFLENDRLLHQIVSQDVMLCVMNSTAVFDDFVNLEMMKSETCNKRLDLEAELVKRKNIVERDVYTELSNSFVKIEKHCISLELDIQRNLQIFKNDKSCNNQNSLGISEYFENNDLKAQLQANTTICKLKEHMKSMRENNKEAKVKQEMDEIETINIELEHSAARLLFRNELLHKEIEHLKNICKDHFDSIKKTRALSMEHCDSLIAQFNSKSMENTDLKGMFKLDLDPLAP